MDANENLLKNFNLSEIKTKSFYGNTGNYEQSKLLVFDKKKVVATNKFTSETILILENKQFIIDCFYGATSD